jgi:hypothetical protein
VGHAGPVREFCTLRTRLKTRPVPEFVKR